MIPIQIQYLCEIFKSLFIIILSHSQLSTKEQRFYTFSLLILQTNIVLSFSDGVSFTVANR